MAAGGPVYNQSIYSKGADVIAGDPSNPTPFAPAYEGNPLTAGYLGYQGYGVSPYAYISGPYGYGSFGYEPGNVSAGYSRPAQERAFDNVSGEKRPRG